MYEAEPLDYVLDLDLDFFVWPVSRGPREHDRLPDCECERVASEEEVHRFLGERCHLNPPARIQGRELHEHVEAFGAWRDWLLVGELSEPFGVVHVDGHADVGAGLNLTFAYLDEFLALPLGKRRNPRMGEKGLNSGNYLLGAIANRWVASLTYVYPTHLVSQRDCVPLGDFPPQCFKNNDLETKQIQLKGYSKQEHMKANPIPIHIEPCVPFELVPNHRFEFSGFTHMVVAQSPQYTPRSADRLLPIIRQYLAPA